MIMIPVSDGLAFYINPKNTQILQIVIQSFPVGFYIVFCQLVYDLRHRDKMLVIR